MELLCRSSWQLTRCSNSRSKKGSLLCLVMLSVLVQFQEFGPTFVRAVNYNVGGSYVTSWTNSIGLNNNATELAGLYAAWAKSVTISVGDSLVFVYDDLHTVVKLPTKAAFDACNINDPNAVTVSPPDAYSSGPTIYNVTSTDPLYFVCGIDSHCAQGQKVAITNIQAPPASPEPSLSDAAKSSFTPHFLLLAVSMALLSTLL